MTKINHWGKKGIAEGFVSFSKEDSLSREETQDRIKSALDVLRSMILEASDKIEAEKLNSLK